MPGDGIRFHVVVPIVGEIRKPAELAVQFLFGAGDNGGGNAALRRDTHRFRKDRLEEFPGIDRHQGLQIGGAEEVPKGGEIPLQTQHLGQRRDDEIRAEQQPVPDDAALVPDPPCLRSFLGVRVAGQVGIDVRIAGHQIQDLPDPLGVAAAEVGEIEAESGMFFQNRLPMAGSRIAGIFPVRPGREAPGAGVDGDGDLVCGAVAVQLIRDILGQVSQPGIELDAEERSPGGDQGLSAVPFGDPADGHIDHAAPAGIDGEEGKHRSRMTCLKLDQGIDLVLEAPRYFPSGGEAFHDGLRRPLASRLPEDPVDLRCRNGRHPFGLQGNAAPGRTPFRLGRRPLRGQGDDPLLEPFEGRFAGFPVFGAAQAFPPPHGPPRFDLLSGPAGGRAEHVEDIHHQGRDDQSLCGGKVQPLAAGLREVLVVRFITAHGGAEVKEPLDDILQTAPGEQRFGGRRGLGDGFGMGVIAGDIGPSHGGRFFDDILRAEKMAMRIDRFLGHDVLLSVNDRCVKKNTLKNLKS